jgi:hypothetical protein
MTQRVCRTCEVAWVGDPLCWSCGEPGAMLPLEQVKRPVFPPRVSYPQIAQ